MSTTLKFLICGICLMLGSTATIISFGNSTASDKTEIKTNVQSDQRSSKEENKSHKEEDKSGLKWEVSNILNHENGKFWPYKISDINAHYKYDESRTLIEKLYFSDAPLAHCSTFIKPTDIVFFYNNTFLIANGITLFLSSGEELKLLVMHRVDRKAHNKLINNFKTNAKSSKLGKLQKIVDNHCDSQDLLLKDILKEKFYNQLAKLDSNTKLPILNDFFLELNDAYSLSGFKDFQTTLTDATKHLRITHLISQITKIEITTKIYYNDKLQR